ncbi:MAG: ComF family protein [Limisphaerales bacterium]
MKLTRGRQLFDDLLGLVYPRACALCGEHPAAPAEGLVCAECWSRPGCLRFIRPPYCDRCGLPFEGAITSAFTCGNCAGLELDFVTARAAVVATEFVLEIIHRYKYSRALWFEPFLLDLLGRAARPWFAAERVDLLIPVPLHPLKEREREFNQSARLSAGLGRMVAVPVRCDLVRRRRATPSQTRLTRAQRTDNMAGAFTAEPGPLLHRARVVVVDDVLTTGATTSAVAHALRTAGAARVDVWTVARGI